MICLFVRFNDHHLGIDKECDETRDVFRERNGTRNMF
jgi:hypothetical protein